MLVTYINILTYYINRIRVRLMISHKINHNGVGVVRGQWHIASKN